MAINVTTNPHPYQPGPARKLPRFRPHLWLDAPLVAVHASCAIAGYYEAFAALSAAIIGIHAWAAMAPRSPYYMRSHWRMPAGQTGCALTFDDGPHPEYTPAILDILAQHQVHATFFIIGEHARQHPQLIRRMYAEGHSVGLHSQRHQRTFNILPRGKIIEDLYACAASISDASGQPPPRLFRPPVGLRSPQVADAVNMLGLVPVLWSHRAWDTGHNSAATIEQNLLTAAQPRQLILAHDGLESNHAGSRQATVTALAAFLPRCTTPLGAIAPEGDRGLSFRAPPVMPR